jgi:hypothetical protein
MSEHTPGSWRVEKAHDLWAEIRSGYGLSNFMIADCVNPANARLIAAAPDLLEALEFMLSVFNETYPDVADDEEDREAWAKARAAIKKATGEQQ